MKIIKTILTSLFCLALFTQSTLTAQVVSTVEKELTTPWEGFGYNQWGYARESNGVTFRPWDNQLWQTTRERILAIKPSLVRLPLMREWFNMNDAGQELPIGTYNWDNKYMQAFYKIMDLYKEENISVLSGLWHSAYDPLGKEPIEFYKSQDFARLQADLLNYLINVKGYTNIKFYTPTNEPLGYISDFNVWKTMMKNLHQELTSRGLPTNILVGADSWSDWRWLPARENKDELIGYDFHNYLNDTPDDTYRLLYERKLETDLVDVVNRIYQEDNTNKPILISEMAPIGVPFIDWPVAEAPSYCRIDTYEYGLGFWDYGIQLARSGVASGLAWGLDGFDQNKNAGMWNNAGTNGGMTLRPWYYTWQLMCRYFPEGAKILKMSEMDNQKDLRIVGAKVGAEDYSFVIVNRRTNAESKEQEVVIKATGGQKTFYVYTYDKANHGNGSDLSLPYSTVVCDNLQTQGVTIRVPLEAGVLITTMAPLTTEARQISLTNLLDFETEKGYSFLSNPAYATDLSTTTNPRKRDPNLSDNVCRITQNMPIDLVNNPNDAHVFISLDSVFEIKAETPILEFQSFRNGYAATFRLGFKLADDPKIYAAEFVTQNRIWEERKINLVAFDKKKIESFVVFPNVNFLTQNMGVEESMSIDNIIFGTDNGNATNPELVSFNQKNDLTSICNFTFEQKENTYLLAASQNCGTVILQTNPSKSELNSSDKVFKSSYTFSSQAECNTNQYSVSLNPYPKIMISSKEPYLRFQTLRGDYLATTAIEIEIENETAPIYHTFQVDAKRKWFEFDVDLKTYIGKTIKNIKIYPNINPKEDLTGKTDDSYYDNIRFASSGLNGIEEHEIEKTSFYIDNNNLHIVPTANINNVVIYSLDGNVAYRNHKFTYDPIYLEKGVYILSLDNKFYKIINN